MSNNSLIAIFTVLGIVILLGGVFLYPKSPYANGALDGFAQCLSSKGIKMYGEYWCPHCQNQKAAFGDSFKYINYVECSEEVGKCAAAGIEGVPAWTLPDGEQLVGEQKLEALSTASGCELPAQSSSTQIPL